MIKFGISTYCLRQAIAAGEMTLVEAITWIAGIGAEHVEIVPIGRDDEPAVELIDHPDLVDAIRRQAEAHGITISNYCIGADFAVDDKNAFGREIERVKKHVDVAAKLGVKLMRHDVASRPRGKTSILSFQRDLPTLAEACGRIADYAKPLGITTSVENHGYYVQNAERVQALVAAVGRENYRTTVDAGNFLCADGDPVASVKMNLDIASMIHLKDFYIREENRCLGVDEKCTQWPGWLRTTGGKCLRGSILGQGDVDVRGVVRAIKASSYSGYVSLEFEGLEECRLGTRVGFEYMRRLWEEG